MRKFYRVNNYNIIAISESSEGERRAEQRGYKQVAKKDMSKGEKAFTATCDCQKDV